MPGAAQVVSRFQLISLLGIHRNTHGVEFSSFWIPSSPRSKSWSPEMYPIPGEQWILWNAQKMPLWGIAHPRSQILRFPPRSASDIYCQFWALFQNGPFSYLAAERLEFRRDNIFHFVVVQAKEYQGVATSKLVYNPDIRDDGRYLACRVLPTSKAGKSLEDTWEIKVLCESEFVSQNHFSISLRPLTQNLFLKSLRVCSQNKGSLAPPRQMNFPKNHLFWWSSAFLNQIYLFKTQPKKDENLFSDKPQVSLRLGASLDPDNLRTGGSQW